MPFQAEDAGAAAMRANDELQAVAMNGIDTKPARMLVNKCRALQVRGGRLSLHGLRGLRWP